MEITGEPRQRREGAVIGCENPFHNGNELFIDRGTTSNVIGKATNGQRTSHSGDILCHSGLFGRPAAFCHEETDKQGGSLAKLLSGPPRVAETLAQITAVIVCGVMNSPSLKEITKSCDGFPKS